MTATLIIEPAFSHLRGPVGAADSPYVVRRSRP